MRHAALLVATTLAMMASTSHASDANYGRNMASACSSCHGTDGKSVGGMEALAGYPKDKMIKAIDDFRSGAKPATVMHQLAKGYKPEQIDAIATFYAAQK